MQCAGPLRTSRPAGAQPARIAGTRQIEFRIEAKGAPAIDEWLRPIGFALCVSLLATAGYLAIQDHHQANRVERERLSGLAFKRGPVCGIDETSATQPLVRISGPIEVRLSGGSEPFNSPTTLLDWGLPVVRISGRDYSYASAEDGRILTSVSASTTPAAILVITDLLTANGMQTGVKLVEQATGRTVFDQVWRREAGGTRYCPDYSTYPKEGEQPRKLITEALALPSPPAGAREQAARSRQRADNQADAVIVSNIDALGLTPQSKQPPATSAVAPSAPTGARRSWQGNLNCPDNVGWSGRTPGRSLISSSTGWPFTVGDRDFYPGSREQYNALCSGEHAYLFTGYGRDGKYWLNLEKRRLSDFHRAWSGTVVIKDEFLATGNDILTVERVDEDADGVTIALTKKETGRTAVVKAALRLSP